jgi:nucleolar complex protein 3
MNQLYTLIHTLSLAPTLDAASPSTSTSTRPTPRRSAAGTVPAPTEAATSSPPPTSDLLFRALNLAFAPCTAVPPWRAAAFAKRLLTAALHWSDADALRALDWVAKLMAREPRLEALLSTEDRTVDGVYRPDVEDAQLSNPFATSAYELHLLQTAHIDVQVREAAANLANYVRTS